MTDDIHETPSSTQNFQTELATQLAELVPEAIADGKVNVEKLKLLLEDDAVDDGDERFGLFWPGKKRAIRAAQEPTTATLKPDLENSKDWDTTKNVFIEGDNLEVLKILQKHYHAKVKMIYIDPPYNTGKDFVYPDNYKEGLDTYLEWTKQVNEDGKKLSTNAETEGRYHSNWLNMMYPRLKLARNLLKDDGLIFISIDDNELANLTRLCNEVFGESNYLNTIVWHYGKMSNERSKLPNNHEYVLVYKRSAAGGIFEKVKKEDSEYRNRYIRYVTSENTVQYGSVKGSSDNLIKLRVKKVMEEQNKSQLEDNDVLFDFNREFKSHSDVIYVSTIKGNSEENVPEFDTGQKPLALMTLLLKFGAPEPNALILDFFSGSGSTAHAVMQLNSEDGGTRQHIQVQLPEPVPEGSKAGLAGYSTIADLSRKRISRVGNKLREKRAEHRDDLDVGYRAYSLTDTNFSKWKQSSTVKPDELQRHLLGLRASSSTDDATPDDLLTEILIKQGYSLTEDIVSATISGLKVHLVYDNDKDIALLAYLAEETKPSLEQARELVDMLPTRIIVLEDAFHGDDELKTNLSQLCKSKAVELWTV
ncbi:MAG: site-specific DNA-methyltransferase [Thermomicrobiales bacterium]|nr:site-specific DNA-methyltransferase [Thermomicrobiales bacterium]MCO5225867.1 site-specific DNA-methyltransferase [Thermomicrobiales bacterium]MCO5228063.1 site-specific DNA-methyltransferase [Thermomicrobiales bacterium]